jgi:hypothetical protein
VSWAWAAVAPATKSAIPIPDLKFNISVSLVCI